MKVEKISYEQLFPTGVYANQRYRMEILIEESDYDCVVGEKVVYIDEAVQMAFKYAKEQVEKNFIALNPQIQFEQPSTIQASLSNEPTVTYPPNVEPRSTEEKIIEDINSCKDFKTLETYKFIQKQSPALTEAYNNKLKSFQ